MSLRKRLSFKRVWNFNTVSSLHTHARTHAHTLSQVVLVEREWNLPELIKEICLLVLVCP